MKYSLIPFASLLFFSSCAWYRNLERSLDGERAKKAPRSVTVSRSEYDQLLVKYQELSKKYEKLKEGASESSLVDEIATPSSESAAMETVNVFADARPSTPTNSPDDVDSQISLYRRGLALKSSNPDEATKIFQQLEAVTISPVKARAKYQIAQMLLGKGQYDLALQVFEDIIQKHANSGVVLKALEGAVTASDQLGITSKKDQYASMLNDVFGS